MSFDLTSNMKSVERKYPYIKSFLHSKFHIGSCKTCAYNAEESIQDVAKRFNIAPNVLLDAIHAYEDDSYSVEISPEDLSCLIQKKTSSLKYLILDVREEWEFNLVSLDNSKLLEKEPIEAVFDYAKDYEQIIFVCHHGVRSLNAAMYYREKGLKNVMSLKGGIDEYRVKVDPSLKMY